MPPLRLSLHCRGVVQGVGFRPAVARLAAALGLSGSAINETGGVRLELWGERQSLATFVERLPRQLPEGAQLDPLQPLWSAAQGPAPEGLTLGCDSASPLAGSPVATALVADRAPCAACLAELHDPGDRRYRYPFISCCRCGPRYSIATQEPFSRGGTTLADFSLCAACSAEFDDPANRRFHAETIGCWTCGPRLQLLQADGTPLTAASPAAEASAPLMPSDPLSQAVALLRQGAILALQGVGGFQLLALAQDAAAVARLRARKRRPHKPLALLVDDPQRLHALLRPNQAAMGALRDPAAPIVLLPCPASLHGAQLPGVAPGAAALGVMLPASPLHWLLAEALAEPLVATSGNRSGEPLCLDHKEALERLSGIADAFLVHDRPIARRLDDSVLQVIAGRPTLLRRSRGYAPQPLALPPPPQRPATNTGALLALGGDLKASPALALQEWVWPAPHLGDLQDRRCQDLLAEGIAALADRWGGDVGALLGDAHPEGLGRLLAARWPRPVPWVGVQHHLAHALSVVAEHHLELPLLALCADGLGYGAPELGHQPPLWGCELLWITASGAERLASLRPLPLPGGDQAQREPRRLALGLLAQLGAEGLGHPGAEAVLAAFQPAERRLVLQALAAGLNCPLSSSLGRLFDAVASILDLCQVLSYEGQSGLLLQGVATDHRLTSGRLIDGPPPGGKPMPGDPMPRDSMPGVPMDGDSMDGVSMEVTNPYPLPLRPAEGLPLGWLDWHPLLLALLADRADGQTAATCSARFHQAISRGLAELLGTAAGPRGCHQVVLAGGCFQNGLLLHGLLDALRAAGLQPHWGEQLPCNDGGLALGQIWAARMGLSITPAGRLPPNARDVPCRKRTDPGDPPPPSRGG